MRLRNIVLAIIDQGPPWRFITNLFLGNIYGLFHIRSHVNLDRTKPKAKYNHKATATKAASDMTIKTGNTFAAYKCSFCDGYHIGKNRTPMRKKNV